MAHNDLRLQATFSTNATNNSRNQFSASSSSSSTSSTSNGNNINSAQDPSYNQYGDDSMIALVLGDLDFLMMTETEQQQQSNLYQQQQQQQLGVQQATGYQTQSSLSSVSMANRSAGLGSGVNLADLHDEQSERIKSEVLDMNILNMMPAATQSSSSSSGSSNSGYYSSSSSSSGSTVNSTPAYLPQLSMNSTTTMLGDMNGGSGVVSDQQAGPLQLDPNFDFIFPDKSSKEILECLINDETDMFDSLYAPRIDYINNTNPAAANTGQVRVVQVQQVNAAPLRSVSSQLNELFQMDNEVTFVSATPAPAVMHHKVAPSKGKGKFLRGDVVVELQSQSQYQSSINNPRASARLQSKRIVNCTKQEPMEPAEPVLFAAAVNMSNSNQSSFKRKRSYQDDDGSDQSNDASYPPTNKRSSPRELSQMNSLDSNSMNTTEYDAENQMLLQQSSQLLAALQRQARLTGNKRLSSNMKDIERELQVLNATNKSPSAASKGVPNMMALDSRRSSLHSADYHQHANNNGGDDDDSSSLKNNKDSSNKDAAFRYRLKKLSEKDRLFETRELLERENGEVKRRIDLAQAEISYLKTLLVQMLLNKGYLDSSRVVS